MGYNDQVQYVAPPFQDYVILPKTAIKMSEHCNCDGPTFCCRKGCTGNTKDFFTVMRKPNDLVMELMYDED